MESDILEREIFMKFIQMPRLRSGALLEEVVVDRGLRERLGDVGQDQRVTDEVQAASIDERTIDAESQHVGYHLRQQIMLAISHFVSLLCHFIPMCCIHTNIVLSCHI